MNLRTYEQIPKTHWEVHTCEGKIFKSFERVPSFDDGITTVRSLSSLYAEALTKEHHLCLMSVLENESKSSHCMRTSESPSRTGMNGTRPSMFVRSPMILTVK